MSELDNHIKADLAELASDFTAHDVELDITDFTIDEPEKQEIHLWVNINAQRLSSFTRQMRPHLDSLTAYQQDCYHMAIEFLKTTDRKANLAAVAWLYEIAEANPCTMMEKEINNFLGFCEAEASK